jgi:DNA-binding response OmpR family regulator
MLVEHDAEVRTTLMLVLQEAGYSVLPFARGDEALAVLEDGLKVAIFVTEVHLPDLNGWDLARAVRRLRPGLPILYTPAGENDQDEQVPHSYVLPKAFNRRAFLVAVRLLAIPPNSYH